MKAYLLQLAAYEQWANCQVIEALEKVSNPPERAVAVMGHILSAQHVWLGRLMGHPVNTPIWADIPVSWMLETAERQYRQVVSYVEGLTESDLNQPIAYTNSKGVPFQHTAQDLLTHLSHHAAYHRGQVVQLIRPMLPEAPVTDYVAWLREKH